MGLREDLAKSARAVGISSNTLLKWMKLPQFEKEYRGARRAAVSQTNARFQGHTGAAAPRARNKQLPSGCTEGPCRICEGGCTNSKLG